VAGSAQRAMTSFVMADLKKFRNNYIPHCLKALFEVANTHFSHLAILESQGVRIAPLAR
jgi:hypothetical protein